jgi:WD40 repeat protein
MGYGNWRDAPVTAEPSSLSQDRIMVTQRRLDCCRIGPPWWTGHGLGRRNRRPFVYLEWVPMAGAAPHMAFRGAEPYCGLPGVPGERMEVLFSPDGRTVSVDYGGDETVVWNGETGEFILQTMGQEHYPDWENYGIDVVWVERNEEFFRRQEDGPALARLGTTFDLRGEHEAEIFTLLLSPDGSILASAGGIPPEHGYPLYEGWEENAVIVWDTATGEPIHRFLGHTGRVVSLSWSPDGQILASGSLDGTVILWEMTPQR